MLKTEASSCDRLMNKKLDNVTLTTGVPPLRNEAKKKNVCGRKMNCLKWQTGSRSKASIFWEGRAGGQASTPSLLKAFYTLCRGHATAPSQSTSPQVVRRASPSHRKQASGCKSHALARSACGCRMVMGEEKKRKTAIINMCHTTWLAKQALHNARLQRGNVCSTQH